MAVSVQDRITYAYAAGFRGDALAIIVSITLCECGVGSASGCEYGCVPDAAGVSCGVCQVYQPAHPGTAACASNPSCAFTLAWSISSHGTNFHPWSTYNDGCYLNHLASVRATIASMGAPIGSGSPGPSPPPPQPCPSGYAWDGVECVPGAGPPPPQPSAPPAAGGGSLLFAVGLLVGGGAVLYHRHHHGSLPGFHLHLDTAHRRPATFR